MKYTLHNDTITLYRGDCLEVMQELPDQSVDAVVTDPPFGIGFKYGSGVEETNNPVDYWNWFAPIYAEANRVLKDGGFIAVFQAQKYNKYFWQWFGDDIHIYCAAKNFVQINKTPINYGYDPVVMRYKSGAPLRPVKPQRNIDFFIANTAAYVSKPDRIERGHPCPRPIDQMIEIVDNFTLPGGTVLDLFSGSCTTGVASLKTGRSFIGIEQDETYFNLGLKRIGQTINDLAPMNIGYALAMDL